MFRTGTRLVVETVSVKDKDGKPIEGLTAKDFTLTEDGEPQTISFVEFQRLPKPDARSAPRRRSAHRAAGVRSRAAAGRRRRSAIPAPGDTRYRDRRLMVLYFDLTAMPPRRSAARVRRRAASTSTPR